MNNSTGSTSSNMMPQKRPRLQDSTERASAMKVEMGQQATTTSAEPANRNNDVRNFFSAPSEMPTTSSSATMKEEVISVSSDTEENELDDEDEAEQDDYVEAEADQKWGTGQEYSAAELASMAGGLVATANHLRAVRVPLFMVGLLAEHNAGDCLRGCLVVCFFRGKGIIDEIDQVVPAAGEIRFKHSRKSYKLKHLQNTNGGYVNDKLFNQWVEEMAKWNEPLPSFDVHKKRLLNAYECYKRIAKELAPMQRSKMEQKLRREMKSVRKTRKRRQIEKKNGTTEQNLRRTQQRLLLGSKNKNSSFFASSDDEATIGELSMDKLVHTRELLNAVCLSYDRVQKLARYPAHRDCLLGCFVKCRARNPTSTIEIIVGEIAEISSVGIRFKHSEQSVLLDDLLVWDGQQISNEVFARWIEDMTRFDEPLPSIRVCKQRNKRALETLKRARTLEGQEAAKNAKKKFGGREMVGQQDTRQIVVDPRQLVQLLQLGEAEFTRVASGLFVRYSLDASGGTMSLDQIRTVSFDHPAYVMYSRRLTVRLHFERPAATAIPILNVQIDNRGIGQQLIEQRAKMVGNFVPPSTEFILWKKEQLRDALAKTPAIVEKPYQSHVVEYWRND